MGSHQLGRRRGQELCRRYRLGLGWRVSDHPVHLVRLRVHHVLLKRHWILPLLGLRRVIHPRQRPRNRKKGRKRKKKKKKGRRGRDERRRAGRRLDGQGQPMQPVTIERDGLSHSSHYGGAAACSSLSLSSSCPSCPSCGAMSTTRRAERA